MDTAVSKTTPKDSGDEVRQFQLGMGTHDGTQYNFLPRIKFSSVRLIESQGLHHHSAWLYDDAIEEVVNGTTPMDKVGDDCLEVENERFKIRSDDETGSMSAFTEDSELVFQVDFNTPLTFDWGTPLGAAVIHQPLIRANVTYKGSTCESIGYCKRFWFYEETDFLAWRFIEGEVGGGQYMLWTADGNFGGDYNKYDYFKIANPNGNIVQAGDNESYHRDNGAYATIDGVKYEVEIEGLGTWSTVLHGDETLLKLRQRFCKLKVMHDGKVEVGYAINETGVGAIR